MPDDFAVFRKIQQGDIKAFEEVFRLYYTALWRYASGIAERDDVAEEVVQDVFYNIWKERENIELKTGSLKNYLYGAVRNHSLRHKQSVAALERYREYAADGGETDLSPQELMEYGELESVVGSALSKMPERRRTIFLMHRTEGKTNREIAAHFGVSVKTVEAEMTKSFRELRQAIEKYENRL
ncbi:MAG: RNA polymerase sigma-70 factor [Tannerella sp.]|jgi:RNA polymerase sigma-70 factor (ECF subfamily)|nr:RNA polymerase sigma-70 factor [Tannerella sp.]